MWQRLSSFWHYGRNRLRTLATAAASASLTFAPSTQAADAWPATVEARYILRYNGIDVGHLAFTSDTTAKNYAITSTGEVSLLFGAIKWTGASNVSGAIEKAAPVPQSYGFDWKKNSKGGIIRLGFTGRKATTVTVEPPSGAHPDTVALTDRHKADVLDPMSAIMALTKANLDETCDRRVQVFDGKQRFDIVLSYKRKTLIPAPKSGGASSVGFVCRAVYAPIAGHRANADTAAYAANTESEVVLRRVGTSRVLIPHSVTVPTSWGTGSMGIDRVIVTEASGERIEVRP